MTEFYTEIKIPYTLSLTAQHNSTHKWHKCIYSHMKVFFFSLFSLESFTIIPLYTYTECVSVFVFRFSYDCIGCPSIYNVIREQKMFTGNIARIALKLLTTHRMKQKKVFQNSFRFQPQIYISVKRVILHLQLGYVMIFEE